MVSDDFNRADGGKGSNWLNIHNSGGTISGNELLGSDAGTYSAARWDANEFNATQTSQVTKANASNYVAAAVRMTAGANYYAMFSHGSLQRITTGSNVELANVGSTAVENDTITLEISGSLLDAKFNGVSQGTHSDGNFVSGKPGVAFFDNVATLDDWQGTGETGGGGGGGSIVFNMQIG